MGKYKALNIKKATRRQLLIEYRQCENIWSKYSCDCLGYYMGAIQTRIMQTGGFPVRK